MIELVWDAMRRGTGRTASGASLAVGEGTHFSPADLVSLAASSCLMKTFLALADAAKVPLLSYLSTADLADEAEPGGHSRVRVRAFITTTSEDNRRQLEALVAQARAASSIGYLLGDHLEVVAEFLVFPGSTKEAS